MKISSIFITSLVILLLSGCKSLQEKGPEPRTEVVPAQKQETDVMDQSAQSEFQRVILGEDMAACAKFNVYGMQEKCEIYVNNNIINKTIASGDKARCKEFKEAEMQKTCAELIDSGYVGGLSGGPPLNETSSDALAE